MCGLGPVRCALFGLRIRRRPSGQDTRLQFHSRSGPRRRYPTTNAKQHRNSGSRQDRYSLKGSSSKKRPSAATCQQGKSGFENLETPAPASTPNSAHSLPILPVAIRGQVSRRVTSSIRCYLSTSLANGNAPCKILITFAVKLENRPWPSSGRPLAAPKVWRCDTMTKGGSPTSCSCEFCG